MGDIKKILSWILVASGMDKVVSLVQNLLEW